MELHNQSNPDREAYKIAQQKVRKLKGFYLHMMAYTFVNGLILFFKYNNLEPHENFITFKTFSLMFYWGIGLVAHGFSTFVPHFAFGKGWEERKMKQFMEREKKNNWE